jgi:cytochrome c-type biogenesis protein CcmE
MTELDLSPRPAEPTSSSARKRRKWLPIAVLALVLVAGGVMVTQFLRSAVDYYCNVDEVGTKSGCEAGRRLRVQGEVVEGSRVDNGDGSVNFTLAFNGASLPVHLNDHPGGLFQECISVVVHGRLTEGVFQGTDIEVKHSNDYEAKNAGRVEDGRDPACSQRA